MNKIDIWGHFKCKKCYDLTLLLPWIPIQKHKTTHTSVRRWSPGAIWPSQSTGWKQQGQSLLFSVQSHWSSADINIIIPLSAMGGQDAHIWKRGEREAWWALQGQDRKLDMVERVNYIGKPENSWTSRLLGVGWLSVWSWFTFTLWHTHTHIHTHGCLASFPLLVFFSSCLCPSCPYSRKKNFFS